MTSEGVTGSSFGLGIGKLERAENKQAYKALDDIMPLTIKLR